MLIVLIGVAVVVLTAAVNNTVVGGVGDVSLISVDTLTVNAVIPVRINYFARANIIPVQPAM
jgi:hypothetical protein